MSELLNDVTIAIKTFERPESLKDLLISIRRFYPAAHIKIADDSKNPSVQDITSCFSNIEYIPLRFDVGLSAGRNVLLSRIKTKYFVLCDDDFLFYEQTRLEDFKKILEETDVELVGGCVMDKSETGEFDRPNLYAGDLILDAARHLHMKVITPWKPFVICDIVPNWFMAKTQAVRIKTGGWDPKLKIEEHTDFFWRAKTAGLKVAFASDVKVNHTLARNPTYHLFRRIRNDKYYYLYFKKLGIEGFTDTWETVRLRDVEPKIIRFIFRQKCIPMFIIRKWGNVDGSEKLNIKKMQRWLSDFVIKQKCTPWFIICAWRNFLHVMMLRMRGTRTWLKGFVFEQKCIPWFVILKWRTLSAHIRMLCSIETIDLEKTYVGNFMVDDTDEDIVESKDYKCNSVLLKDSRHVRFLEMYKDKTGVTDEEIRGTKYYKAELSYVKTHQNSETETTDQCRRFLEFYQIMRQRENSCNESKLISAKVDHSKDFLARVFKVLGTDDYMILDGHHRLSCQYILGKRFVKAHIAGIKKNALQAADLD